MELFDQRYELLEKVGEGGVATVHLAHDQMTGRLVALKMLHPALAEDALEHRYFEQEFRNLAGLDLPGVPPALEFGRLGRLPYFTMKFIEGESLHDKSQDGRVDWASMAGLLGRAAMRLDAIHEAGIIHRDVKASNILIDRRGRPWWIDFGISCRAGARPIGEEEDLLIGTLPYLPPERVREPLCVSDPRTDVYSLGIVFYRLLTGYLPFDSEVENELMLRIQYEDPRPPHEVPGRKVPRAISDVALRAMAKRPEERYPSAWEFAAAIGEVLIPLAAERISAIPFGASFVAA